MERPPLVGRDARAAAQVRGHLRQLLGRPGLRPTTRTTRRLERAAADRSAATGRATASPIAVRPRGPAVPAPGGDPRGPGGGADRPRPAPQPRGRGHRHRQDRRRRARLPPAREQTRPGPALLFVAHRQEILEQALRTYREVLRDGAFGELYVGGRAPGALAARLRLRPVAVRLRHRAARTRPLRRRRHRRVPPRRGADLPAPARPPAATGAPRAHRDAGAGRRRRRPRASSTAAPPPSCGCGTRWSADLLVPVPLLRRRDDVDLRGSSGSAAATTRRRSTSVYTGNDARAAKVLRETRRQGHRRRGGCGRSASACRSSTPTTWPTCSTEPASRPCRDGEHADGRARRRRCGACGRGRSTASSPSTSSTRASTCRRSTPSCSSGPRRAPPSSSSSSAAGCAVPRQGGADGPGLHRPAPPRVPLRPPLPGADRRQPEGARSNDIEHGFPFLPSGSQLVLDRVAQQIVLDNVRGSSRPSSTRRSSPTLRRTATSPSPTSCASPGATRRRLPQRRSWTALRRDGRPASADRRAGRGEAACAAWPRSPTSTIRSGPSVYARLADPRRPGLRRADASASSASRGCCSSRSGPTAAATPRTTPGFDAPARHPAVCARVRRARRRSASTAPAMCRSRSATDCNTSPCSATRTTGARSSSPRSTGLRWRARRTGTPSGVAWAPADCATDALLVNLRKTEKRLLPDHDVPRLRPEPRAVPLGVAERHHVASAVGSATCTIVSGARTWCCSSARRRATSSERERPSVLLGLLTTWSTAASAPSPSPGDCGGQCRRRLSSRHASSRLDCVPGATSHALDDGDSRSEEWSSTPAML